MQKYIGTKIVRAEDMLLGDFRTLKNQALGEYEEAMTAGYTVVYPDGYTSWCPQDVFEQAYRPTDFMTFGLAIEAVKLGFSVTKRDWLPGSSMSWIEGEGLMLTTPEGVIKTVTFTESHVMEEDWVILDLTVPEETTTQPQQ